MAPLREDAAYRFAHAITRTPAGSCTRGLRAADMGDPDVTLFREQHSVYLQALERAGVVVTNLPADENFPDSVFVEDPALCLAEGAILLRSGAEARRGEAATLAPALRSFYGDDVFELPQEALADGGDILVTGTEVLVGISARTSSGGAQAIGDIVAQWGYRFRIVSTPPEILHLKSDCALLSPDTVLATSRLAASGVFDNYSVITVPGGEDEAANAVRVNDTVLLAAGFTRTADLLRSHGFNVDTVPVSEAAKLDAGLSCMSLRFSRPRTT